MDILRLPLHRLLTVLAPDWLTTELSNRRHICAYCLPGCIGRSQNMSIRARLGRIPWRNDDWTATEPANQIAQLLTRFHLLQGTSKLLSPNTIATMNLEKASSRTGHDSSGEKAGSSFQAQQARLSNMPVRLQKAKTMPRCTDTNFTKRKEDKV